MPRLLAVTALASLVACTTAKQPVLVPPPVITVTAAQEPAWRAIARPGDAAVIAALPQRLAAALAGLPRRLARQVTAAGPLLANDAGQAMPQLSPGSYYCRLIRLGGRDRFRSHAPDFCYVTAEGEALAFTKQTGSNLPNGYIYPDSDTRQVFLGTLGPNGERIKGRYGDAPATDVVGVVERVAPFRWRMILSRAGGGATMDLYELVPVPASIPGAKPASQPE
jgi:hypothetical protein